MKLEKLIVGTFAAFVRDGTEVGTDPVNTVGELFVPAADDAVWDTNTLGCVIDSQMAPVVETDTDYCPSETGGYVQEITETTVLDVLNLSLKVYNPLIWELIWGTANPLADDTAQQPFVKKDRFVSGWVRFRLKAQDGNHRAVALIRVKMRINAQPTWAKDPSKPAVKLEIADNALNDLTPDNVVA